MFNYGRKNKGERRKMKKKLLKRLTTVVVAVAMVATMATGFSVDVKAVSMPDCPLKGKSDDEVEAWLKELFDDPHVTIGPGGCRRDGDCSIIKTPASDDSHCVWECFQHFANTSYGTQVSGKYEFSHEGKTYCEYCGWEDPNPPAPPTPAPAPKKAETVEKEKPAKEVDRDTFKSEEPYGTAGITNSNSKVGDLKVHKVNSITETNQKFLADAFAKQHGKKARILTTVSLHPRRELGVDNGKKESLIYSNLEKKPQTVYAVCYNQTDKAYYLTGTLDKDGVATFPDFILRDATNVTIFVLE